MKFKLSSGDANEKWCVLGLCFGAHHQAVFAASFEMWLTALVAVWRISVFFSDAFQLVHLHREAPLVLLVLTPSLQRDGRVHKVR